MNINYPYFPAFCKETGAIGFEFPDERSLHKCLFHKHGIFYKYRKFIAEFDYEHIGEGLTVFVPIEYLLEELDKDTQPIQIVEMSQVVRMGPNISSTNDNASIKIGLNNGLLGLVFFDRATIIEYSPFLYEHVS